MKVPAPVTGRTRVAATSLALYRDDGVSARAFGALSQTPDTGLGQALGNLAQGVAQFEGAMRQRKGSIDNAETLRSFTEFGGELDRKLTEYQRETPVNTENYFESASGLVDHEINQWMSNVPADLREEYAARAEVLRQQAKNQSLTFGLAQQDTFFKQTVADAETAATNGYMLQGWSRQSAEDHVIESILVTDLPEIEKETLVLQTRLKFGKLAYGKAMETELKVSNASPTSVIKQFEGLKLEAYADTKASDGSFDAWRTGYGSDTVVRADGTVEKVTKDTKITRADAERTLDLRVATEFEPTVRKQLGDSYDLLPANARAGLISVAWNYGSLPDSVVEAAAGGDVQEIADAVAGLESNPERRAQEAAIIRGSHGAYKRAEYAQAEITQNADGYWVAPNVSYGLAGKTRDKPVAAKTVQTFSAVLSNIDPSLGAVITSGGQDRKGSGGKRTGSTRHDVDEHTHESETADLVLTVNGKQVSPNANKKLYAKVLEEMAAAGFTGLGHYSWGIHVGGGKRAAWGPSTTSNDLDPEFKSAIERGWQRNKEGIDGDPSVAMVPFEDRMAIRKDVETKIAKENAAKAAADEARQASLLNATLVGVRSGAVGQEQAEELYVSGQITDYSAMSQIDSALEKYQKDTMLADAAFTKLGNPTQVWDPTSSEDRDMLNAAVGENGIAAMQQGNEEYFAGSVLPIVKKSGDIPTEVVGTLTGMARSSDDKRMRYAIDALSLLQRVAPDAFESRVGETLQKDITFFNDRKDRMPTQDLMRLMRGGATAQERALRIEQRKEGETLLKTPDYGMDVPSLIQTFDSVWMSEPTIAGDAFMHRGLSRDYQTLFLDEYERRGDAGESKREALRQLQLQWGVFSTTGGNQLMKRPPHLTGYRDFNGGYEYIEKDVRTSLELAPEAKFSLISDETTAKEFEAYKADPSARQPSYKVWTEQDGVIRPALGADGKEIRMTFEPSMEDKAVAEAEFDTLTQVLEWGRVQSRYEEARMHQRLNGTPIPPEIEGDWTSAKEGMAKLKEGLTDDGALSGYARILELNSTQARGRMQEENLKRNRASKSGRDYLRTKAAQVWGKLKSFEINVGGDPVVGARGKKEFGAPGAPVIKIPGLN